MAQSMQRQDGTIFEELFTEEQVKDGTAQRRREQLEAFGMKFKSLEMVDADQHMPHQRNKQVQQAVKQILDTAAREQALREVKS